MSDFQTLHPLGHVERPSLSRQLRQACAGFPKAYQLAERLLENEEYLASCEAANALTVNRLGYSDHGKTHGLIVAVNAMQIYRRGVDLGWNPNFGGVNAKKTDDSAGVVVLGALLHDVGNSIARQGHHQWGLTVAKPILEDLLASAYRTREARQKMMLNVMEVVLTHDESMYASAMEASVVKIADGMDCESGRSRLPGKGHNDDDRYGKSAMAIYHVHLGPDELGRKLPVFIEMGDASGLFQIEQVLLKKIKSSSLDGRVVVEAFVGGKRIKRYE